MCVLARLSFPYVFLGALDAVKSAKSVRANRMRISPAFNPYLEKTVRGHRYPGPITWFCEQIALKKNRKVKVF